MQLPPWWGKGEKGDKIMDHGGETGVIVDSGGVDRHGKRYGSAWVRFIPGFLPIVMLYIGGYYVVDDVRAVLFTLGVFKLTWVETLLVCAAMMAMFELLRVSKPGINNTIEAGAMVLMAALQAILMALSVNNEQLAMFQNTEFLMLTLISSAQAATALMINARTLQRTIASGGGG